MAPRTRSSNRQFTGTDFRLHLLQREKQFREACNQIVLMNNKLDEVAVRYRRAKAGNQRSHRYHLRLRLSVIEGVRNMYYDFATTKATEIQMIRQLLAHHLTNMESESAAESEV